MNKKDNLKQWAESVKEQVKPIDIYTHLNGKPRKLNHNPCPFCGKDSLQIGNDIFTCHNPNCDASSFDLIKYYARIKQLDVKVKKQFFEGLLEISNIFDLDHIDFLIQQELITLEKAFHIQLLLRLYIATEYMSEKDLATYLGFVSDKSRKGFYKLLLYPPGGNGFSEKTFVEHFTRIWIEHRSMLKKLTKLHPPSVVLSKNRCHKYKKNRLKYSMTIR